MLDQYSEQAFIKMQENEQLDREDDPIYEGEKQPFYHGRLIYKETDEQVDYYRLLKRDWFVAKSNVGNDKPRIMKGWDWREFIVDGHDYTRADKDGNIGLNTDKFKSDDIIYESENARKFSKESPRIGVQLKNGITTTKFWY